MKTRAWTAFLAVALLAALSPPATAGGEGPSLGPDVNAAFLRVESRLREVDSKLSPEVSAAFRATGVDLQRPSLPKSPPAMEGLSDTDRDVIREIRKGLEYLHTARVRADLGDPDAAVRDLADAEKHFLRAEAAIRAKEVR